MQLTHLSAILISLGAHLGMGVVLGVGGGEMTDSEPIQQLAPNFLAVQLNNKLSSVAVTSIPALSENGNSAQVQSELNRSSHPSRKRQSSTEAAPILPVSPPPNPYYFRSEELMKGPVVLQDVSANESVIFADMPNQTAVLRLLINEGGDVDRVEIDDSNLLGEAARIVSEAFSKMKFHPGQIDDAPVKSQITIEVKFEKFFR